MIKDHIFLTGNTTGTPKIAPEIFVEYDIETNFFQFRIVESARPRLRKEAKQRGFANIKEMIIHDCKQHAHEIEPPKIM